MTGRLCYGPEMKDRKGLTQNITLGANILTDWRISGRNNKKKNEDPCSLENATVVATTNRNFRLKDIFITPG